VPLVAFAVGFVFRALFIGGKPTRAPSGRRCWAQRADAGREAKGATMARKTNKPKVTVCNELRKLTRVQRREVARMSRWIDKAGGRGPLPYFAKMKRVDPARPAQELATDSGGNPGG
jgi:hypothetical protein